VVTFVWPQPSLLCYISVSVNTRLTCRTLEQSQSLQRCNVSTQFHKLIYLHNYIGHASIEWPMLSGTTMPTCFDDIVSLQWA